MSENTVTSSDIAPVKVPKSFRDLNKKELVAAAEFFGTDAEGGVEALRSGLAEDGVTFEDYLAAFHPGEAVSTQTVEEEFVEVVPTEPVKVVTAAPEPELSAQQKYLIKFIGENPYFEFGSYKFSKERPYGIMPASDAQRALVSEPTKFRQAYPAELEEFYG